MNCIMCGRPATQKNAKTYKLTTEEETVIRGFGLEVNDVSYCGPCQKLMQDPEKGAQFFKGLYLVKLRAAGVPNAEAIAQKFYDFLKAKARKKALS